MLASNTPPPPPPQPTPSQIRNREVSHWWRLYRPVGEVGVGVERSRWSACVGFDEGAVRLTGSLTK